MQPRGGGCSRVLLICVCMVYVSFTWFDCGTNYQVVRLFIEIVSPIGAIGWCKLSRVREDLSTNIPGGAPIVRDTNAKHIHRQLGVCMCFRFGESKPHDWESVRNRFKGIIQVARHWDPAYSLGRLLEGRGIVLCNQGGGGVAAFC